MPKSSEREEAFDAFVEALKKEITTARGNQASAQDAANKAPTPMESHHDWLRSEADTLAGGHQRIAEGLENILGILNKVRSDCTEASRIIGTGALVTVEDEEERQSRYFVIPGGSSKNINVKGRDYTCVSPQAPVARIMMGKTEEDEIKVAIRGMKKLLKIIEVL